MNPKKVIFLLLLTAIFPVTISISIVSITLRTMHDFVQAFAIFFCENVDKVAEWAEK